MLVSFANGVSDFVLDPEVILVDGVIHKLCWKGMGITEALKNSNFKVALNIYLIYAWNDDSLFDFFQGKTLYANCGDVCYKYIVHGDTVLRREESRLFSTHEEADSRMFNHVACSTVQHTRDDEPQSNFVVRTNDVDCLIIAIGCLDKLQSLNENIKL